MTAYDYAGNESGYSQEVSAMSIDWSQYPSVFILLPNYPNPANPSTTIPFVLTQKGMITITLFDLMGRRVKRLAHMEHEVGRHEVVWDGTDDDGLPMASGVYYYRLSNGECRHTRKLTLLR